MSTYGSPDVGFILVDEFNLLGTVTSVQDGVEAILQEITALGDAWARFLSVGIRKGTLLQQGFYDDASGGSNAALVDSKVGTARVFSYNLETDTIGKHFIGHSGPLEAKYDRVLALEKLHMANAMYQPSGPIEEGRILHTLKAETTSSGNTQSTPVDSSTDTRAVSIPITSNSQANPTVVTTTVPHGLDSSDVVEISGVSGSSPDINGEQTVTVISPTTFSVPVDTSAGSGGTGGALVRADSDAGGSAYLHITALTLGGYDNVVIKVQHSADNSSWSDLVTVVTATAVGGFRTTVAAGTLIKRYLAVSWAFGGSGSGPSVTFMAGFARS